jgi:hypothetical protein
MKFKLVGDKIDKNVWSLYLIQDTGHVHITTKHEDVFWYMFDKKTFDIICKAIKDGGNHVEFELELKRSSMKGVAYTQSDQSQE